MILTLKEIKKIHKKRNSGCVAIGVWNKQKFFSINGVSYHKDYDDKICEVVQKICKTKTPYCKGVTQFIKNYKYSYLIPNNTNAIFDSAGNYHNIPKYDAFFKRLNKNNVAGLYIPTVPRIPYLKNPNLKGKYKKMYDRFWSCAEKKLFSFQYHMQDVYITKQPCYLCLPVVSSCTYYNYKTKTLEILKIDKIITGNKRGTYFRFKR